MLHAFLLLLSCMTDYETVQDLAHGAFTAGLVNMSALGCIGAVIALRRSRLVRG